MDDDGYKILTSLLEFLTYNDGSSGVVIEADVVQLIAAELQRLLEEQQGGQR